MTIQAIIFDIGGVLSRRVDWQWIEKWETRLDLSQGELANFVWENELAKQAVIGAVEPVAVWDYVAKHFTLNDEELLELQEDFFRGYVFNDELLAFISTLRPHYKTAILSDAWIDARLSLQDTIHNGLFDVIYFSAEQGMQKPNPAFYQKLLDELGVQPEEAIFIDDRVGNIEGAEALGIHGVVFTNTEDVLEQLAEYLDNEVLV